MHALDRASVPHIMACMNGPSREEIDAKLAANKSWLDSRISIFDMDMKTLMMRMDARDREALERHRIQERQRDEEQARWEKKHDEDHARWEKQRDEDRARWEQQRLEDKQQRADEIARWEAGQRQIMSEFKGMRRTVILTGITVVLGVAAFNATLLSGMVSSFEAGKSVASARAPAR